MLLSVCEVLSIKCHRPAQHTCPGCLGVLVICLQCAESVLVILKDRSIKFTSIGLRIHSGPASGQLHW